LHKWKNLMVLEICQTLMFIGKLGNIPANGTNITNDISPKRIIGLVDCNLRHLQHHVGQLDIILRREQNIGNPWIIFGDLSETSNLPEGTSPSK